METSGFTFVTSGKKRDSFKGIATLKHVKFIEGVRCALRCGLSVLNAHRCCMWGLQALRSSLA
jgi:hypothetical protein